MQAIQYKDEEAVRVNDPIKMKKSVFWVGIIFAVIFGVLVGMLASDYTVQNNSSSANASEFSPGEERFLQMIALLYFVILGLLGVIWLMADIKEHQRNTLWYAWACGSIVFPIVIFIMYFLRYDVRGLFRMLGYSLLFFLIIIISGLVVGLTRGQRLF
jgi:magnesium-transporting ATPase (P-type)